MKRNTRKLIGLIVSTCFVAGLLVGKAVQDSKKTYHCGTYIIQTSSSFQNHDCQKVIWEKEAAEKVLERLQRTEEMRLRALEQAERAVQAQQAAQANQAIIFRCPH